MEMGRSPDPALDLPVLMMFRPSSNFGSGDQVICSTDGTLTVDVGRYKVLT